MNRSHDLLRAIVLIILGLGLILIGFADHFWWFS